MMRWLRVRLRSSSFVALFALALQLALSFGHVHLGELSGRASAQIDRLGTAAPPSGDTPEHSDGYCALCAIIHLTGAWVPAAMPSLPEPAAYVRSQPRTTVLLEAPTQTPSVFAARAPPSLG